MTKTLEEQAQEKLAQARQLIKEAGRLAKEGQFLLSFGEVGVFVPSCVDDEAKLREKAIENLRREGRYNGEDKIDTGRRESWGIVYEYVERPSTPFDQIPEGELEEAIETEIEAIKDQIRDEIGYDAYQYGSRDRWWAPSRC